MGTEPTNWVSIGAAVVSTIGALATWAKIFVDKDLAKSNAETQLEISSRNSRATVVSANRQRWIDAIRDDIADIIATTKRRNQIEPIEQAYTSYYQSIYGPTAVFTENGSDYIKTKLARKSVTLEKHAEHKYTLDMLTSRIEMRLNTKGHRKEEKHVMLMKALRDYDKGEIDEDDLTTLAKDIFKPEWERLKMEASGVDPDRNRLSLNRDGENAGQATG